MLSAIHNRPLLSVEITAPRRKEHRPGRDDQFDPTQNRQHHTAPVRSDDGQPPLPR
ncbi:hypothetical protein SAMN04489718_0649 [Actinopolyspora saharensis]|uniref:Uncharacterized protein n=1 Tax=Actinopolyspora saharensis TaxID=995062 RepID=A0A1H0YSJ8_9ACTN|nr:hypothetical protein SAMN04489718_0649 [Actinopolyspora saharensis]